MPEVQAVAGAEAEASGNEISVNGLWSKSKLSDKLLSEWLFRYEWNLLCNDSYDVPDR